MNEAIEPSLEENGELENQILMKRSFRRIIGFFVLASFVIVCTIILRNEPLYLFNTLEPDPSIPLSGQIFRIFTYGFIFITFGFMIWFSYYYFQRRKLSPALQNESLPKFKNRYSIFDLFGVIPVFLAFVIIVNGFFVGFAVVDGISMEPSYYHGDYTVILHYNVEYQKDDIVIFQHNDKLIKRLIAMEGDYLHVSSAGVFVNGSLIEDGVRNGFEAYEGVIPKGYYFVLGDNRDNSNDSRYFGLISESDMLGKVIYPLPSS